MKVSAKQLDLVLSKIKHVILGWSHDDQDFDIQVSLTKEDPGNGIMLDCLTLTAVKLTGTEEEKGELTMSVEIYPTTEKLEPIASKTESFKVTKRY